MNILMKILIFSYVRLNSMNETNGNTVKNQLNQLKYDNVILDLRDNYGGIPEYASRYIYPALFSKDYEETSYWYMPVTKENDTILEDAFNRIRIKPQKVTSAPFHSSACYYKSQVTYQYKGDAEKDRNLILLTSRKTGSAADRFVSDMKKNGLAVVIGNNTGGEGLMNSYNMVSLPNSKFVCVYMVGGAQNPDGSDNSVYGTVPDFYVANSIDDYYVEYSKTDSEYCAIREYDAVLNYAIEYFQK